MNTQHDTVEAYNVSTGKLNTKLIVNWAGFTGWNLDQLFNEIGPREFAELCFLEDAKLGQVLEFRVHDGQIQLVEFAKAQGFDEEWFYEFQTDYLIDHYGINIPDGSITDAE